MLSKEKCIHAIKMWGKTKANFTKIKELIDPSNVFYFTQRDCDWIKKHNENSSFRTYAGISNNDFILIIVPLDKKGNELELDSYLTTKLTTLKKDITLVETKIVTTITKTVLSKNLEITKHWKEVDLPTHNEPTIKERTAVSDIEKWKNECLDWFYFQCNTSEGKNIFNSFTIPFADLEKTNQNPGDIISSFGFRYSTIYNTLIPILVFITTDDTEGTAEIMRPRKKSEFSNIKDWAHPCPPLCNGIKKGFSLF